MTLAWALALICLVLVVLNLISDGIAIRNSKPRATPLPAPPNAPGVTIVRPCCGIDNFCEETLGSSFGLDYPAYEVIFCVARSNDPVIPVLQKLIAANPGVPAKLIIGDERISANPKLNNCVRGWEAARHEWVILADFNVLMPRDYIQRLLAALAADDRPRLLDAARLASAEHLGRTRDRLPQYLSGALAICGRRHRHRLRPRQEHALAPRYSGRRGRYPRPRGGDRGRRRLDQSGARRGP